MVKQTIQIFCRVKPPSTKVKTSNFDITEDTDNNSLLSLICPREVSEGLVNNKKETFKFKFQKVFPQNCTQDDVFANVAKPVIDNVLTGYNGTIFAYGQTGSGKTFTITGGPESYADRGIIPRTISYIYDFIDKHPDMEYTVSVSYLELYNENGYDLLDPKHEASKLEDLPKVTLYEDTSQQVHLKNLSLKSSANEEEALNLLFVGDTNRMIAETPMNQASTRSHCIFSIYITCKEVGSATVRRSKLHLVDLAGSERVSKTGVNGLLLTEAKYINLSLHYLEQVIIALSEKNRTHVPYRNSMMTSVLRDSLGGNCMTSMIATVSIEYSNLGESISTCRFAQRVALIKNDAILNEELDPQLLIQRLRKEIDQLKAEIGMLTGKNRTDDLTEEEIQKCRDIVNRFLTSEESNFALLDHTGCDSRMINLCFVLLKDAVESQPAVAPPAASIREPNIPQDPLYAKEMKELRDIIIQRDNELNILVGMLKKEKRRAAEATVQLQMLTTQNQNGGSSSHHSSPAKKSDHLSSGSRRLSTDSSTNRTFTVSHSSKQDETSKHHMHKSSSSSSISTTSSMPDQLSQQYEQKAKGRILGNLSMGRQEAFEIYKQDYQGNDEIEQHKRTLKAKYAEAKSLGERVNKAREAIQKLKSDVEKYRLKQALAGGSANDVGPEEQHLRSQMEDQKEEYRVSFQSLKGMKAEIEHLQHTMVRLKVKLIKSFEVWWEEQCQAQAQAQLPPSGNKSAWATPPSSAARHEIPTFPSRHEVLPQVTSSSGIQMTGDKETDAEIMAFMRARQNLQKFAQKR